MFINRGEGGGTFSIRRKGLYRISFSRETEQKFCTDYLILLPSCNAHLSCHRAPWRHVQNYAEVMIQRYRPRIWLQTWHPHPAPVYPLSSNFRGEEVQVDSKSSEICWISMDFWIPKSDATAWFQMVYDGVHRMLQSLSTAWAWLLALEPQPPGSPAAGRDGVIVDKMS